MSKITISLLIGCIIFLSPTNGELYKEEYRLQLHYSQPSGWMNDPNGLVYVNGYYHLFYQYNPHDTVFGPIHWGHARSTDLIHWENMPVAIEPYEKGLIYSGCAVLDKNNATGFGSDSELPLIAIYSLHNEKLNEQSQGLSYSLDNGTTWTYYDANPIIPNPGIPDFRDPNIFERNGKFYMVLAVFDRISFYESSNLMQWEHISDFGLDPEEGDKDGVWECPSMFAVKDDQNNEHDVLVISENIPKKGSAMQYFIGKFNGTAFSSYDASRVLWLEHGNDNFAGVPYHSDPLGRIILIGWMSNWNYAMMQPTSTWRGQMTIPRELGLKTVDGNLHLVQRPVDELNSLVDHERQWSLPTPYHMTGNENIDLTSQMTFKTGSMLKLNFAINIKNIPHGEVCFKFGNCRGEFVSFHYNISSNIYSFDRRNSGNVTFSPDFVNRIPKHKRISTSNLLTGQILLDKSSIEIFADDGLNVFSELFFPSHPYENFFVHVDVEDSQRPVTVETLSVQALNSIWEA